MRIIRHGLVPKVKERHVSRINCCKLQVYTFSIPDTSTKTTSLMIQTHRVDQKECWRISKDPHLKTCSYFWIKISLSEVLSLALLCATAWRLVACVSGVTQCGPTKPGQSESKAPICWIYSALFVAVSGQISSALHTDTVSVALKEKGWKHLEYLQ